MSALVLDRVRKEYPGRPPVVALRSLSISIAVGELVGVVGPSGSGKSTLLAIAGTLELPTAGRVRIGGIAVDRMGDADLSAVRAFTVGFVFQQYFLLPTQSALENVTAGLLYQGVVPAERKTAAEAALERVGLAHRSGHRPGELSGGERQRVAIARALVGQPEIILADEPTGNVDSVQSGEIMDLLSGLSRDGTTVVVVTHDPDVADHLTRVIRLRDGVVEDDTGSPG
jgi:putative ABC transport system ATP-binding protein